MFKKTLPLLFLLLAGICTAQTTYTQKTLSCHATSCSNAEFSPSGTLSYTAPIQYCGDRFSGTATWDGVLYNDFTGKMTWLGYQNHYPYGTWQVQGTFNGGTYTVTEIFVGYRTCNGKNTSGTVVGP